MTRMMTSDRGTMMGGMNMGMSGMMMMPMMNTMGMNTPMTGGMSQGMGNMMMLPRCTMKMEKTQGGMTMTCMCDDKTAAMMLQNMCMMMPNALCGCCMMMNGMMCCCCNMTMGTCKVEMMEMGCTIACTSGDPAAVKMIQACCDCMNAMMMPGCTWCMMMNNMPMCCCVC